MKVTVIGAGNVGATCADVIARKDFVHELVLLDIKQGIAEGKALDIWQTSPINIFNTRVEFDEGVKAIAPGQSAVFYEDDDVIGGGIIQSSFVL